MCATGVGVLVPQGSAADAVVGSENVQGPPGLPDGRVYEESSPANKFGNQVRPQRPAFAAADGQAVFYGASGAVAPTSSNGGFVPSFVSERTSHGWVTRSAMPLPVAGSNHEEENVTFETLETLTVPSADLSHLLFGTWVRTPYVGPPDEGELSNNIYLEGPDPFVEPEWVGRSLIEGAPGGVEPEGESENIDAFVAGASPDLKTIYFFYTQKLFPGASHLYEYSNGVLSDAGVLPGEETSAGVAFPAAEPPKKESTSGKSTGFIPPAEYDNQVSADGSRLFFTRKDEAGQLELYVHMTAPDGSQSTALVSQSQIPGHVGEPAPSGPIPMPSTEPIAWRSYDPEHPYEEDLPSRVFASPNGSHAFFSSTDRLTVSAPEGNAVKMYDFDVDTGTLEYVPGITGSIVTVSRDGSSFEFENTATSPFELDRWVAGPGGGSVVRITQLPSFENNACHVVLCVGPAYTSDNGSAIVFSTESPIAGFNDGGSHYERSQPEEGEELLTGDGQWPNREVFRYDIKSNRLTCISCPPKGVTPSANAILSKLDNDNNESSSGGPTVINPGKSMSADGERVVFQTREALVPQDVNGTIDVYEWENGTVFLISSGRSPEPSYLADASESGGDVFIATSERIAFGDTDGSYDMYDARIPRPGDQPPPEALPCSGDVCQGPPSVPQLLGAPASEEFSGAGDLAPSSPKRAVTKSLTRAQKLAQALKVCKRRKDARKRHSCERQARRKYNAEAGARNASQRIAHNKGRGN